MMNKMEMFKMLSHVFRICSKMPKGRSRSNWCRPKTNAPHARTESASVRCSISAPYTIATFLAKRQVLTFKEEISCTSSAKTIHTGKFLDDSTIIKNKINGLTCRLFSGGKLAKKAIAKCVRVSFPAECCRRSAFRTNARTRPITTTGKTIRVGSLFLDFVRWRLDCVRSLALPFIIIIFFHPNVIARVLQPV